jgi:hypothetical protein
MRSAIGPMKSDDLERSPRAPPRRTSSRNPFVAPRERREFRRSAVGHAGAARSSESRCGSSMSRSPRPDVRPAGHATSKIALDPGQQQNRAAAGLSLTRPAGSEPATSRSGVEIRCCGLLQGAAHCAEESQIGRDRVAVCRGLFAVWRFHGRFHGDQRSVLWRPLVLAWLLWGAGRL